MIVQLKGKIIEVGGDKDFLQVVIDVNGVGYEVLMTKASEIRVPLGVTLTLYVRESVAAFDGTTTLYGFATKEETDLFVRLRENVDGMGPKKALECLDKISKSLPDFKRALIDEDVSLLVSVFGFTKKTADKLVLALKGKMEGWTVSGAAKWTESPQSREESDAVSGLVNLGYSEMEAREVVGKAKQKLGASARMEAILQEALRMMAGRL